MLCSNYYQAFWLWESQSTPRPRNCCCETFSYTTGSQNTCKVCILCETLNCNENSVILKKMECNIQSISDTTISGALFWLNLMNFFPNNAEKWVNMLADSHQKCITILPVIYMYFKSWITLKNPEVLHLIGLWLSLLQHQNIGITYLSGNY